jgi:phosphomannomutase
LVVIDENGDIVDGDNLLGALSVYLKEENLLEGDACVAVCGCGYRNVYNRAGYKGNFYSF